MSTGVLEPVADPRPADGGAPARRAVVRWAWRLTEHAMREFHIQATTNDWLVQGTSPSLLPRSPGAELTAEQLAERGDRRARHHPRRGPPPHRPRNAGVGGDRRLAVRWARTGGDGAPGD